ncbi:MAG: MerR family transcriptional regulator [Treponema sp.]|nr:MerR family transcriptional regulator [Treponema sp.]
MTITTVAEKYGLSPDTLRYYERIGLIPPVQRNKAGNRDYSQTDCNRVEFVKCMRSAGIPVESLIEYVRLFLMGAETREARKTILQEQRELLAARIAELQKTLDGLDIKIANFDARIGEVEEKLHVKETR